MHLPLGFDIGESHHARRLDLERDRAELAALGRRCAVYLRQTTEGPFGPDDAPSVFLEMLRSRRVPAERSFVLGVFRGGPAEGREPPRLVGVLYFLHPDQNPATWYILLLLLEPAARKKGLGSAVHTAFSQWSAARGARRLVVAVSEANGQALHFWRDRLGYAETASHQHPPGATTYRRNRELEYRLAPVSVAAPWMKLRV